MDDDIDPEAVIDETEEDEVPAEANEADVAEQRAEVPELADPE